MSNTTKSSKPISVSNEYASLTTLLADGIVRITGKDHLYRLAAKAVQVRAAEYPGRTMHITSIFDTATNSYLVATNQKAVFAYMSGKPSRYRAVRFLLTPEADRTVAEGAVCLDVESLTLGTFRTYHYDLSKPVLMRRGLVLTEDV